MDPHLHEAHHPRSRMVTTSSAALPAIPGRGSGERAMAGRLPASSADIKRVEAIASTRSDAFMALSTSASAFSGPELSSGTAFGQPTTAASEALQYLADVE